MDGKENVMDLMLQFETYMKMIAAKNAIFEGKYCPLIENDKDIQRLREVAYTALEAYIAAYYHKIFEATEDINRRLSKTKR